MIAYRQSLILVIFLALSFSSIAVHALNVGPQIAGSAITVSKDCSRKCESEFCTVPPLLRYGKYCGLLYSGCAGEAPCDGLDACCMKHDACVQSKNNDYLSQECSQNILKCMDEFQKSGTRTFTGNTCDPAEVINLISVVMEAALLAGRSLHRP
ncbi:hypothetical protein SLA2020_517360 [Shorea laevis]